MTDAPPLNLDGFSDAEAVGHDERATLYRARQDSVGRDVAVKVFHSALGEEPNRQWFEDRVAKLQALSSHPNIRCVFEGGTADGEAYLVAEWLPAGSLADRLAAGRVFEWPEVLDIGVKLAGALASGHKVGLFHQRLAPENVLVNPIGEPLLADFDIEPGLTPEDRVKRIERHRAWSAPELAAGRPPSVVADVYGLGSLLTALILGRAPRGISGADDVPDLGALGVPAPVVEALASAMATTPSERPATAAAFGRSLAAARDAAGQAGGRVHVLAGGPGFDEVPPVSDDGVPAPVLEPDEDAVVEPTLLDQVRVLVRRAVAAYENHPARSRVAVLAARLDEPLRVAIAGRVKAGKSTLLNALVGEELAPTDAGECTRIVTWYTNGVTYRATLFPRGSEPVPTFFSRPTGAIEVDLGGHGADELDHVVIDWPSSSLASMTLIDTPGIGSVSAEVSERTLDFFRADSAGDTPADAVLYLMRHVHPTDVRFLEAFHEHQLGEPSPINSVAVLSRADEVGVARPDALESAARIARRYREDPRVRRLAMSVVPVAGLLAQAGATLRQQEYESLVRLAGLPEGVVDELLVSVDRFVGRGNALDTAERRSLLDRLGLFGVRLAVQLIRKKEVETAQELAHALGERSGLAELRDVLATQFATRADVLKANHGLQALSLVLRQERVGETDALLAETERITAGAHEFAELRLLSAHRAGVVEFAVDEAQEVDRLLGVDGRDATARLGLPPETSAEALRTALIDTMTKWQRRAASPVVSRPVAEGAAVLVRTCEGMLARLSPLS